nr:hypothetical protein [Burkholderia cepacia]
MGTVWEYQYEYTDLEDGKVKLYPFWLTETEAGNCQTLIENDFGRKLQRRERVGPPAWREAYKVVPYGIKTLPEFDSPMHSELVELYRRERDPDVRRVILEVGVVCGRGRNPTLRLWPAIFSGEIDVFPSERRNMGQEIGR